MEQSIIQYVKYSQQDPDWLANACPTALYSHNKSWTATPSKMPMKRLIRNVSALQLLRDCV